MTDFNFQKTSYNNFWDPQKGIFKTLLLEFFKSKLGPKKDVLLKAIDPPTNIEIEITEIPEEEIKQFSSPFLYLTDLSRLHVSFTFPQDKKYQIYFGEIPKISDGGLFRINGIHRVVISHLGKPPGLNFYYDKEEEYYKAYFRPKWYRGKGLEITMSKSGNNYNVQVKLDRRILLKDPTVPNCESVKFANNIFELVNDKISLGLEEILKDCYIGNAGRVRTNKFLKRFQEGYPNITLSTNSEPYLTKDDLLGAVFYLKELVDFPSEQLGLGDKYSLSERQLYILSDFMEEQVWGALESVWMTLLEKIKFQCKQKKQDVTNPDEQNKQDVINPDTDTFMSCLESVFATIVDCRSLKRFTREILAFFMSSPLARIIQEENLLAVASLHRRVSLLYANTDLEDDQLCRDKKRRDLHWTHYGRLCPVDTPQGDEIGIIYSVAKNAIVEDGEIKCPYYKVKLDNKKLWICDGEEPEYLSTEEEMSTIKGKHHVEYLPIIMNTMNNKPPISDEMIDKATDYWIRIAYGDQNENLINGQEVIVRTPDEEIHLTSSKEISYIDAYIDNPFSWASLLVPFLMHNDANRSLMASNSIRQALPLESPEAPWVKTGYEKKLVEESGMATEPQVKKSIGIGSSHFCVGEIDINWFKKEHKYQYNLINDILKKLKINLKNNNSVTPKRLTKAFNKLIQIPNLVPLLNENKGISGVLPGVPDTDTIVTNKQKVLEIYPHTLEMILKNGMFCFGKNLLVGYLPYKGLNFEDAIVISKSAANKLTAIETIIYRDRVVNEYQALKMKGKKQIKIIKKREENTNSFIEELPVPPNLNDLDERGIIKPGSVFKEDDVLIRKITYTITEDNGVQDTSLKVDRGCYGKVKNEPIPIHNLPNGDKLITINTELRRPVRVGDKLANRHGGKGVVSAILDDEEMPYFSDKKFTHTCTCNNKEPHTHLDVILNPLGVFSRINLGQLFETHLGLTLFNLPLSERDAAIEPIEPYKPCSVDFIRQKLIEKKLPENGKVALMVNLDSGDKTSNNGINWIEVKNIVVGYQYIMRLEHIAEDKLGYRGSPGEEYYSLISQQPTKGRIEYGGQRFGEMETWVLGAYGADKLLQELLTAKSDNPHIDVRDKLEDILSKNGALKGTSSLQKIYLPEFLQVLAIFLRGLGVNLKVAQINGEETEILGSSNPTEPPKIEPANVTKMKTEIIDIYNDTNIKKWSCGEVKNPEIGLREDGYNDDGLFSRTIFGSLKKTDERRYKMGCINLERAVIHPFFIGDVAKILNINQKTFKEIIMEKKNKSNILELLKIYISDGKEMVFYGFIEQFYGTGKVDKIKNSMDFYEGAVKKLHELYRNPNNSSVEIEQVRKERDKILKKMPDIFDFIERLCVCLSDAQSRKEVIEKIEKILNAIQNKKVKKKNKNWVKSIKGLSNNDVPPTRYLVRYVPVIPPIYRPYDIDTGREQLRVCSDITYHYCEIIRAKDKEPFELQQAVTRLFDSKMCKPSINDNGDHKESLLTKISGNDRNKESFFREHMLGKTVDYSARAVIVPGTNLKLDECSIPLEIILELFWPMIKKKFSDRQTILDDLKRWQKEHWLSTIGQKIITISEEEKVITEIEEMIKDYPILINRQPSLHKLNIQAFYPKINRKGESALYFQPLVTGGYNADHDGDTVAMHLPIQELAIKEAKKMLASNNVTSPANGKITLTLSQDIALGIYCLTLLPELFEKEKSELEKLGPEVITNWPAGEINKEKLNQFILNIYSSLKKNNKTGFAEIVEKFRDIGFKVATSVGFSLSLFDFENVKNNMNQKKTQETSDELTKRVKDSLDKTPENPVSILINSGARGNMNILQQMIDCRGHMLRIKGSDNEETPLTITPFIWSSVLNGHSTGDYFVSCYGARKSLVDKKLGVADCGNIARQFIEIMSSTVIVKENCNSKETQNAGIGLTVRAWKSKWHIIASDKISIDTTDKIAKQNSGVSSIPIIGILYLKRKKKRKEWIFQFDSIPVYAHLDCLLEDVVEVSQSLTVDKEYAPYAIEYSGYGNLSVGSGYVQKISESEEVRKKELEQFLTGRILAKAFKTDAAGTVISEDLATRIIKYLFEDMENEVRILSPLTCSCENGICIDCYGIDPATREKVIPGQRVGIIAAQSLGEPLTQEMMQTFHTGGVASAGETKFERFNKVANGTDPSIMKLSSLICQQSSNDPLEHISGLVGLLDTLQDIYGLNNMNSIHLEVLIKEWYKKVKQRYLSGQDFTATLQSAARNTDSWLSGASFGWTSKVLKKVFKESINKPAEDTLVGFKEKVITGKF